MVVAIVQQDSRNNAVCKGLRPVKILNLSHPHLILNLVPFSFPNKTNLNSFFVVISSSPSFCLGALLSSLHNIIYVQIMIYRTCSVHSLIPWLTCVADVISFLEEDPSVATWNLESLLPFAFLASKCVSVVDFCLNMKKCADVGCV